jgi:formylglycine-generating enzyme required for sulfatase activity
MLLILNAKMAIKSVATAVPVALALGGFGMSPAPSDPVATISVAAGAFRYRVAGEFAYEGRPVNAPLRDIRTDRTLVFMKMLVSAADYDRCVAERACERRLGKEQGRADLPAVGVNWHDATAYATWLSKKTGKNWRLPTDAEWAYAAGSRFKDDAIAADDGSDAFSKRWLAKYDQESYRQTTTDKAPKPLGSFGENERGLADVAGNVWEWTDTCYDRQSMDAAGRPTGARTVNCGVRVVEGEHRSYVTDFIRDARAGGCAVGIPPANLGFRLVREDRSAVAAWTDRLVRTVRRQGAEQHL